MLFDVIYFAAGVIVGAFSHKWLAALFARETGLDAQAVADKVSQAVSKKP